MTPAFSLPVDDSLLLKFPQVENAETVFNLIDHNRDYLREYLPWVDYTLSSKDSEAFLKKSIVSGLAGTDLHLLIWKEQLLLGLIGLHYIDHENHKTEIGYWLASSQQGKGVMSKCCHRLIRYCFEELKIHRIEIRCHVANQRSQLIPKRLGFKQESLLREALCLRQQFFDCFLFSLLATDPHPSLC